MIVDTSVLLAVLFNETDAESYASIFARNSSCRMSAASFLEAAIVVESRGGAEAGYELDIFLDRAGIEVVPVTYRQVQAARRAWRRFGRGNHPAGLNFGDCLSYALAEISAEPLLFKGEDFALTDIDAR